MVRWGLALGWGALAAGLHAPPRHAAVRHTGLRAGNEDDMRAELGRRITEDVAIAAAPAIAVPAPAAADQSNDLDVLSNVCEKLLIAVESDAGVQPLCATGVSLSARRGRRGTRFRRRERIVVLGSGWGAASLVSSLGTHAAVTVISPRNYFLFTPMLAGAAVGTVRPACAADPPARAPRARATV
jgi:hypothetical protein